MTIIQSLLLGFTQGITEFLPVSSSGHLVLFQKILNLGNQIQFDVFLHFATLFALLIFFRDDIWKIVMGLFGKSKEGLKILIGVVVGSLPTAVMGLLFKDLFEKTFSRPTIILVMLSVTGLILWFSSKFENTEKFNKDHLTTKISDFLLIGLFQGIAIMPGISRAGITIATALILGFNRKWAFKYSMLLSIPAIFGAGVLELKNLSLDMDIAFGGTVAFLSGILALYVLSKIVVSRRLYIFSYYLWTISILGLLFLK